MLQIFIKKHQQKNNHNKAYTKKKKINKQHFCLLASVAYKWLQPEQHKKMAKNVIEILLQLIEFSSETTTEKQYEVVNGF